MIIKRAGLAILIQDKADFKLKLSQQTKTLYDDKEVNLPRGYNNCKYTCTLNWSKYIKQTLKGWKGELENNTIITEDRNTGCRNRTIRQKLNKETEGFNNTIVQMNLIDIYRTFHLTSGQYAFFSSLDLSLAQITKLVTEQVFTNFKKLKLYQVYFLTTMEYK